MTRWHWWTIIACIAAVAACLCSLLLSVRADVVCLPRMAATAQAALLARMDRIEAAVDALPGQVVPPVVAAARAEIRHGVDLSGAKVDAATAILDRRTGDALARIAAALQMVDSRASEATGALAGIREDAQPVLKGAAAIETDAQASWDDLYWDLKASVESATVAARGIAETSEAIGKAAPALAQSAEGIGASADGIAADVHTATTDFVKPRTWGQKLKAWLEAAGKIAARFI